MSHPFTLQPIASISAATNLSPSTPLQPPTMALPALPAGAQPLVEQVSEQLQAAWHKVQPYAKVGAADEQGSGACGSGLPCAGPSASGGQCLSRCSRAGCLCWQQPPLLLAAAHPPTLLPPPNPVAATSLLLVQTALHWGYIPAIIAGGMLTTEPRPSWVQLLGPM